MARKSFWFKKPSLDFFEKISNQGEFLNELIQYFADGKLNLAFKIDAKNKITISLTDSEDNIKNIIDKNRAIKITVDTDLSHAKIRLTTLYADYLENFGAPLSNSGKRYLSPNGQSNPKPPPLMAPIREFKCEICKANFSYSDHKTMTEQKEKITDHYYKMHYDIPSHVEDEILERTFF